MKPFDLHGSPLNQFSFQPTCESTFQRLVMDSNSNTAHFPSLVIYQRYKNQVSQSGTNTTSIGIQRQFNTQVLLECCYIKVESSQ